jgi:O-antigen/teichoic acid export membrane protein
MKFNSTSKFLLIRFISLGISGLIQLVLPIYFIRNYGASTFGLWVLIFSISSLMSTSDLGWIHSLSLAAIQERAKSSTTNFESYLFKISQISRNLSWIWVFVGICFLFVSTYSQLFALSNSVKAIIFSAILSSSSFLRMRGVEAIFRANGSTLGFSILTATYLVNSACTLLLVILAYEIWFIAVVVATVSILFMVLSLVLCKLHLKSHGIRLHNSSPKSASSIGWTQAIGFFSFPSSYLLLNEGINIMVAVVLGTTALGQLSFIRTYVGLFRQITTLFTDSFTSELAHDIAAENFEKARVLFRKMARYVYSINISLFICILIVLQSTSFLEQSPDNISKLLFIIFVLSALLDVPWNIYIVIPTAINQLRDLSIRFVVGCGFSVLLGFLLVQQIGLMGIALALLVQDFVMTLRSRKYALEILDGPHAVKI